MATPIAIFVSPHGFGHAARAAAVVEALSASVPDLEPQLFTTVPQWFFEDSLSAPFGYEAVACDVGMAQRDALTVDLAATVAALERLYGDGGEAAVGAAAGRLRELGCRLALCDISPLGLLAAERAGIPGVLVESFTWEWIYRAYLDEEPRLGRFVELFEKVDAGAVLRVQTEPICEPVADAISLPPVCRPPRGTVEETRTRLGLDPERGFVLLSMGGLSWRYERLDLLAARPDLDFVVFAGVEAIERRGNLLLLPERSPVYHPDLVRAADAVVGKLGYSTVAEAWAAGQRYAYLPRPGWPEHSVLAAFIRESLPSLELGPEGLFAEGALDGLGVLLDRPRAAIRGTAGASAAAAIASLLR